MPIPSSLRKLATEAVSPNIRHFLVAMPHAGQGSYLAAALQDCGSVEHISPGLLLSVQFPKEPLRWTGFTTQSHMLHLNTDQSGANHNDLYQASPSKSSPVLSDSLLSVSLFHCGCL